MLLIGLHRPVAVGHLGRDALLQPIAADEVPPRPGRKEPRVCKGRQNKYTFMTKPRHDYNANPDSMETCMTDTIYLPKSLYCGGRTTQ